MLLEPALVAAEALLDALGGLVEARVSILGPPLRLEHDAGIEMDGALGPEARPLALEGDVAGETAVEIFLHRLAEAGLDLDAESVANIEILAGNAQTHGRLFEPASASFGSVVRAFARKGASHGSGVDWNQGKTAAVATARRPVFCWAELLLRMALQVNRAAR